MRVPNTGDKPPPPTAVPKPTTKLVEKGFTEPQGQTPDLPPNANITDLQPAGFGRRLVAYFVDAIILMAAYTLLIAPLYGLTIGADIEALTSVMQTGHEAAVREEWTAFKEKYSDADVVQGLASFAYLVLFWGIFGATPGKMVMNVKVVRLDGSKISPLQAVGRALGYWLSGLILMLGFIWILFDGKKQGWHDKIASTLVVKTK